MNGQAMPQIKTNFTLAPSIENLELFSIHNYFFESWIVMTCTFVIFLGSGVPVSNTSTFWYTFGEFTHFVFPAPLWAFANEASKALRGLSFHGDDFVDVDVHIDKD